MLVSGQYQVIFTGEEICLKREGETKLTQLGVAFLLDSSRVKVNPIDDLVPCFDLDEMTKRNTVKKG